MDSIIFLNGDEEHHFGSHALIMHVNIEAEGDITRFGELEKSFQGDFDFLKREFRSNENIERYKPEIIENNELKFKMKIYLPIIPNVDLYPSETLLPLNCVIVAFEPL